MGALCQQRSALCPVQRQKVTAGTESLLQRSVQRCRSITWFFLWPLQRWNVTAWPSLWSVQDQSHRSNDLCRDGKALLDHSCNLYRDGKSPLDLPCDLYRDGKSPLDLPCNLYRDGKSPLDLSGDLCRDGKSPLDLSCDLCRDGKSPFWPSLWPLQRWKVTTWPSLWPVLKPWSAAVGIHLSAAWVRPHPCYICLVCRNTVGRERTAPTTLFIGQACRFNDWPHLTAVYRLVSWLNGWVVVSLIWLTDWFCCVWCCVVCAAVLFMLRGCSVSRALTVWCCSRQQVDLDVRQHVPPTLRPSAPLHPAGCGASAAGSSRQHHGAQHALTWHLAPRTPALTSHLAPRTPCQHSDLTPGSPNTPPTPWPRTWLPAHPNLAPGSPDTPPTPWPRTWLPGQPANTLTSHLAPRTPHQHPDLAPGSPHTPPTPWPRTWLPAHPANTLTSHLALRTPCQHPDLAPGSPNTPPTPWPRTWLPQHPANTLTSHLAPCTPRQHPDLAPGSLNTPPTPQRSTHPDLLPDTPPTPWPGTWLPRHPSYQLWDVHVSAWPLPLLFAVLRAMFTVVGLVRQAASCLFTILRHTAGYLFREVLATHSLFVQWGLVTQLFIQ